MYFILLILMTGLVYDSEAQSVGEVDESSTVKYHLDSSSDSDSGFEENLHREYPSLSYERDSFDDVTSQGDPLLVAPDPPFYSGPWDIHREEVSITGVGAFNSPHRGWPTNLPRLPNFGPPLPYPALNSRSVSSEAILPSTLSAGQHNVQRSQQP